MTRLWMKNLYKDVNVLFTINVGLSFWNCSMYEPFTVLIVFPLAHFQTPEIPVCYGVFHQPLKYRTTWRPDSNILSSMDVGNV